MAVKGVSPTPTPYRLICSCCDHEHQVAYYLTTAEFHRQNKELKALWVCPACGGPADFDNLNFLARTTPHETDPD